MCRASDNFLYTQLLRITSVYVRFLGHDPLGLLFPDSLTLVYLPRISEAELEINGEKVRPDSPAFVTLHRVIKDGVAYGCRDKVRARAGLRFEVYLGEQKLLKGTFRKEGEGKGWEVECRCVMERETSVREGDMAEVLVRVEGGNWGAKIQETVRMVARSKRRKGIGFRNGLEEIPEESEAEGDGYDTCCIDPCSCCRNRWDVREAEEYEEVNTEGVMWAVDVGIWLFCLGVGFFVSRASSKQRRKSFST